MARTPKGGKFGAGYWQAVDAAKPKPRPKRKAAPVLHRTRWPSMEQIRAFEQKHGRRPTPREIRSM